MTKSSLITFIERYGAIKMNHTKLKELWKKIDKSDFDHNEVECFLWFQNERKRIGEMIKNGTWVTYKIPKPRSEWRTGWTMSDESRKKLSESKRGINNPSWKGGITPLTKQIRHCQKYKDWRRSVYERDNYTCIECGEYGGILEADHIKPFSFIFGENNIKSLEDAYSCHEFWDIGNGRTMCKKCHSRTDTHGVKSIYRAKA